MILIHLKLKYQIQGKMLLCLELRGSLDWEHWETRSQWKWMHLFYWGRLNMLLVLEQGAKHAGSTGRTGSGGTRGLGLTG